jgi:mannose-6-phosphate isomerase-like protein (cupin superfamily)
MTPQALTLIDIKQETNGVDLYKNIPLALVNDHNVRLSVMTEPYYWHYHPNSDESFLVMEGVLCIDLEGQTIEVLPGQLFTIPANVAHRTWPKNGRSVNITFELTDIQTVQVDL